MFRERITTTFLLAALGLVIFGAVRPSSPDPIEDARADETWFFINKARQGGAFDGVIVGDSRALRAVSPSLMAAEMDGETIFNFAFKAGGMNDEMFDAAEKLIAEDAERPFVVLAPTSLSFQTWKRNNSQYRESLHKPRDQAWLYLHAGDVARWLQPVSPNIYLRRALDVAPAKILDQEFHDDGWIATDQIPADDYRDLTTENEVLEGNAVDPVQMGEFMARTEAWTARGWQVYAFLPPAYEPRVVLEDSLLGFDRTEFRREFEAAGGVWIDIPRNGFETYDGSHLRADSARELSAFLGRKLAELRRSG